MSFSTRKMAIACGIALLAGFAALQVFAPHGQPDPAIGEWRVYGGDARGDRYSELDQITPSNVVTLAEAWRVDTGPGGLQTSPLMAGGTLYVLTPDQAVLALDPGTGAQRWKYTPADGGQQPVRGLAYWQAENRRALFTSHGTSLTALDPASGVPIDTFGKRGSIDLREGLGREAGQIPVFLTTPGAVYRDLVIVGFRTSESRPAAPGAGRAYDARTGQLRWQFNTLPRSGDPGSETWPPEALSAAGGANAWAGMVVDEARGIVYVPTGSSVDDFYGADRTGNNLYANSLLALDANTGKLLWHFQGVHHDIWDRDFPTPPVLLTVRHEGHNIDAVAQGTKQGLLFLFDRQTGKPLFPIEERPVPRSEMPGEVTSPTQPFPTRPEPFARQRLTADMLTTRTEAAAAAAREQFATFNNQGPYTPLVTGRQTLVFPGFDGGAEWGGPAVDRKRGILIVNANDVAWTGGLMDAAPPAQAGLGARIYQQHCMSCHGPDMKGAPPEFPTLIDIYSRRFEWEVGLAIERGKGRMPGFPQLRPAERQAVMAHLRSPTASEPREVMAPASAAALQRYAFTGYRKFLDPDGYPAVAPPWGTLNAIDMNTGEYLWKVPLGQYPELAAQGMPDTGTENYGGPVLTSSGLLFIGATIYDRKFRAFSAATGKVLWEHSLPFAGAATPITYLFKGRQYVVIAASGARDRTGPQGSAYVAFALPRPDR